MQKSITSFKIYLEDVKKASSNTVSSYIRDLKKFASYMAENEIYAPEDVNATRMNAYILYMEKEKFATSTISRTVATLKAFFTYLLREGVISDDPSCMLKAPKIEKKVPGILDEKDIVALLSQPSEQTDKGSRDKAMLELLYATGIRVSELIALNLDDVNMDLAFIRCHTGNKDRVVPFGKDAQIAMKRYIEDVRPKILMDQAAQRVLFTNCNGMPMSRQGFWKILKKYANAAGLKGDITPHTLRHSFAAHLVAHGADLHAVQEMMGHSDISTTQVYAKMYHKKLRDIYEQSHPRA